MNHVSLVGRLTKDPEVKEATNGVKLARFSLAVDRRFSKDGQREADFIPCVAFGKSAEFAEKYFTKGMKIGVNGRIQTGSYTKADGTKGYTYDVIIESSEFCESKSANNATPANSDNNFVNIPDDADDEGLPFN